MTILLSEDLLDKIRRQVRFSLDWAKYVKRACFQASYGLDWVSPDHSEEFRGLFQQVSELERLEEDLRTLPDQGEEGSLWEEQLFARICDIYSLYPSNPDVLALFRYLWRVCGGMDFARLVQETQGRVLYLHISCAARLEKARASVRSFGEPSTREAHVIVIGDPQRKQPGINFTYRDGVLHLSVGDVYEAHYQKTLYSYAFVGTLLQNPFIVKLDDDVSLQSRHRHDQTLEGARKLHVDYLGSLSSMSIYSPRKGWHIHKCADRQFHRQGICVGTSRYALGGAGYLLSRKSTMRVRDTFLGTPLLYSRPSVPIVEDQIVGMILSHEDFHARHSWPDGMGLYTPTLDEALSRKYQQELMQMGNRLQEVVHFSL